MQHPNQRESAAETISVSINEGARITGLSVSNLYKCMARGDLPVRKVGRRSLLMVEDLRRFVAGQDAA
jgi:predicted DNA-binding transcriptional regulator AlpA